MPQLRHSAAKDLIFFKKSAHPRLLLRMSPTLKFPEKVSVELLACLQVALNLGLGVQGEGRGWLEMSRET